MIEHVDRGIISILVDWLYQTTDHEIDMSTKSVDLKDDELPKLSGKDDEVIAKSTNSRAPGPTEERVLKVTLIDETRGHTDQQGKNEEAEKILNDSQIAVKSSFYGVDIGNGITASKIPSESKIGKMNIGQEEATSHTAGGVNDKDKQPMALTIEGSVVQTAYIAEGPEISAADKMVFPRREYAIGEISKYLQLS